MSNCVLPLRAVPRTGKIEVGRRPLPASVSSFRQFDFGDTLAPFERACGEASWLAAAFGMMEAMAEKSRQGGLAKALYVIGIEGDDGAAKIGVSANAIKRIAELQAGSYKPLYIHAVAFFPIRNAVKVEQAVLEAASSRGARLRGEWVAADAGSLFREALEYARVKGIPISDARTWFEDMRARTFDLARGQKFRKAA